MSKSIYLPDTNLLFNLAESIINQGDLKRWHWNAKTFWKRYGKQTQIPSLVWAEFCGLWFHKNVDLVDYDLWFERRLSVFNKMYLQLKKNKVKLCDEMNILFQEVLNISSVITTQKMPAGLIKKIAGRINATISNIRKRENRSDVQEQHLQRNMKNLKTGKILDGLDSVIVTFAYEFAKKHIDSDVFVVSDDKFMVETINYFYDNMADFKDYGVPENVSAYHTQELATRKGK